MEKNIALTEAEPMTNAQRGFLASLTRETHQKLNPHLSKTEASHLIQKLILEKTQQTTALSQGKSPATSSNTPK